MSKDEREAFYDRLDSRAGEIGVSYADLTRACGYSRTSTIHHMVSERRPPSLHFLINAAIRLSCTTDWLLGLDQPKLPTPRYNPPKETQ